MIGGKAFNKFCPFDGPLSFADPWHTASDAIACQQDLDAFGHAFALMHGGRMEHVPIEMIRSWHRVETNDYPESG